MSVSILPERHDYVWPCLAVPRYMLDNARATPHLLIRTSLFSTRKFSGGAVREVASKSNPITMAAIGGYACRQIDGVRMDQGDGEIYAWLLNRAYLQGVTGKNEMRICFTREEAFKELGRSRGTKGFKLFEESLLRLYQADVEYETQYATGRTRLISSIEKPLDEKKFGYDYEVLLSAKLGEFFFGDDFRLIPNSEHTALKSYLAKWLHAFYSSHNTPFPYKTDTIKTLVDRHFVQESKWQEALTTSLADVKRVTGWPTCEVRNLNENRKVVVRKSVAYQPKVVEAKSDVAPEPDFVL